MGVRDKVWLIGGTSDSRRIAEVLSDRQLPWIATVVTGRAQRLYQTLPGAVHVGSLTPTDLPGWLEHHGIARIVDASHPFATEISRLAIATGLPYLRYERPAVDLIPIAQRHPNVTLFQTWDSLFTQALHHHTPKILLTTGLKSLHRVIPVWDRAQWWARILPSSREAAIALGFPRDRLLLQRPPTDADGETELWQTLGINTVLTKASGEAGGLPQKISAAIALQTRLLILERPSLDYPHRTDHLEDILQWLSPTHCNISTW